MSRILRARYVPISIVVASLGGIGGGIIYNQTALQADTLPSQIRPNLNLFKRVPPRNELFSSLSNEEFDVLIIGGGATGTGCALDAASRGLKTAMIEKDDFACGTSSRSTKLVHGGVRYLEKAVKEFDYNQYLLVKEALHERSTFIHIAPHISYSLPIMLPIYQWWKIPYFWTGCKLYDFIAGKQNVESSYFVSRREALKLFPMLKREKLAGALIYTEAAHNDSRMAVTLGMSAISEGATVLNHTEFVDFVKEDDKIVGAVVKDLIKNEEHTVKCKGIINAAGPFVDAIRLKDDATVPELIIPSAGVHLTLPSYLSPRNMGLIDPNTSDGRVLFLLPFMQSTVVGTTDAPCKLDAHPKPTEKEIEWILHEVRNYLAPTIELRRSDVKSAWAGIRPLVKDPNSTGSTEQLVRSHFIETSKSGLVTIAGGKWTTYRNMAQETIDEAVKQFSLNPVKQVDTGKLRLVGSHGYSPILNIHLIQHSQFDSEIATHLAEAYGDRCWEVAAIAEEYRNGSRRIHTNYPYIEAEVRYVVRKELAQTAVDVLARRTRLAFLDSGASTEALTKVVDIMADELGWDKSRIAQEKQNGTEYFQAMGISGSLK